MKKYSVLLLFLLFQQFTSEAQISKSETRKMDAYFTKMVQEWDVPSATIGIVKDGKLVFTGNYGVKTVGNTKQPDANTLYAIASNSKAFTSAVMGMLVQEGKVDWNDKVKDYLPYFAVYDEWVSNHVTIRDLLSHRVGLGTFSGDNIWYKSEMSTEEIIKHIQYVPQAYEFRSGYGYSNLMFITAGKLIETVTGKSWGQNVQERILDPLGMDRTITSVRNLDDKGNYATPHARKDNTNYTIPWVSWDNVAATGGIISSVNDMAKWMIFNLDNGVHKNDTLLAPQTRNMIWTPHNNFVVDQTQANDFDQHYNGYGLGWALGEFKGHMRVSHTGGYDGMITAVTLIPDEKLGVVVLTNGVKSPIMAATYYALDRFLDKDNTKDWSADYLQRTNSYAAQDTRITDRKASRVQGTQPSIAVADILGKYTSNLVGPIHITKNGETLELTFENAPLLSATLTHWHYDVWELHWKHPQAWFSFGTIQIEHDNNMKVTGFSFDVPNDDFFFEELKPYKIK